VSFSGRHGEEGGRELSAEAGPTWSGWRGSCHPWRRRQGCRAIAAVTMSLSPQPIGEIYPAPQLRAALRYALGRVKWRASGRCVTGAWARAAARSNGRLRPSNVFPFCFALVSKFESLCGAVCVGEGIQRNARSLFLRAPRLLFSFPTQVAHNFYYKILLLLCLF